MTSVDDAAGVSRTGNPYRQLLARPEFARLLPAATGGSLASAMFPVAILLWGRHEFGSYGAAGALSSALALGFALLIPARGRAVDRLGPGRALPVLAAISASGLAAMLLLGSLGAPVAAVLVLAFVCGATQPPLAPSLRAVISATVPKEIRTSAYTLQTAIPAATH